MDAFIIIITSFFIASSCGLLGTFLVLRNMAMIGDAISHSVLPGIVIAYIIYGERSNIIILIGAALMGVFTTFLIEFIHKKIKLYTDATIGITYTWLFAIGVIMVSLFTNNVDIDQDCVLYGDINYIILKEGYFDTWLALINFIVVVIFITLSYKALLITSFDVEFSKTKGIKTNYWQYILMFFVSLTTVFSFESVGAILVVGLLIIPPSTALLVTKNLRKVLVLTLLFGLTSSIFGYLLAININSSISGSIILIAGLQFIFIILIKKLKYIKNE